ncbi:50S ribosomal protein L4 [Clostridium thermosuccinogenes]|jgi:large subunit ribosomal protein L4|uniref:Large ribosomal subunit protein uL4 n=1 Tax=Clostridium thermosuccinogenes TaxID=84032 RepID=A0A2K2EXE1_9CLOT|nr:50S ribosomal protein L4 [Pseudoclostridium thermosuccinogenes]AUS98145.1 50S ribosomal protein L4 [Pseudoclostridium thermosuccinogenes]PNT91200.1 50S ribosomal protein L4 [Pseudoclostridium thermosuccinogenes]PNT95384.1 50S ribosomal protein L4 [Pseudoclostridium thermosuccinogenes]PNT96560.1 50S ribosomal protein L4 [Pseudoclostridium thermosuccinogenes]
MPKVDLYNINGEVIGDIQLKDEIFGVEVNQNAIHLAVVNQLANKRQGTQSTKTKSEVRGGGIKPWRQKGTGRARQGSIRSAQWIKGGIVLGPKPRSYRYTLPKKVKRLALKSALSSKVVDNDILVLDKFGFDSIKTKQFVNVLKNLKLENESALVVLANKDENVEKSARNIPGIKTSLVNTINVYDLMKYNKLILTKDAVSKVEEVYA